MAREAIAQMAEDLAYFKVYRSGFPARREAARLLLNASPHVILLDVGERDLAMDLLEEIEHAHLTAPIIGFGQQWTEPEQSAMQECGVEGLLREPFTGPELEAIVYEALHQKRPMANPNIFVFLPAKAGGGCSTVALHTAVALAELNNKVLLIESDRRSGALSFRLNINNQRGLPEALEKAGELTPLEWGQQIAEVAGLHLLAANPARPGPPAAWADYFQLLRFVEPLYDFIVVDLPEVVNQATAEVVRSARSVMIVSGGDGSSLNLAGLRVKELKNCKIAPERVGIILNGWDKRDLPVADAEKVVGQPIFAAIPNDAERLREAQQLGGLAPANTKFGQSCHALAERLAGLEPLERQESKFALFRMLTRLAG